jgi:hypothetical protein
MDTDHDIDLSADVYQRWQKYCPDCRKTTNAAYTGGKLPVLPPHPKPCVACGSLDTVWRKS